GRWKSEEGARKERNGGEVKERVISFRLRPEDYELIEEIARLDGETPNAWARKRLLDEARQGEGLSRKERVLSVTGLYLSHALQRISSGITPSRQRDTLIPSSKCVSIRATTAEFFELNYWLTL